MNRFPLIHMGPERRTNNDSPLDRLRGGLEYLMCRDDATVCVSVNRAESKVRLTYCNSTFPRRVFEADTLVDAVNLAAQATREPTGNATPPHCPCRTREAS